MRSFALLTLFSTLIHVPSVLSQVTPDCFTHIDSIGYRCFENNTSADSSDDYYELTVILNHEAATSADSFILHIPSMGLSAVYAYLTPATLAVPANGQSLLIYVWDQQDTLCRDSVSTPLLFSCSAPCDFKNDTKVEIHCNNAGTAFDTDDDYYSISFEIPSASYKKGYLVTLDQKEAGLFPYNRQNYINHPADSLHHTIEFRDPDDSTCVFSTILGRLIPCSDHCDILLNAIETRCDDMGSAYDVTDDQITLQFNVTNINGSSEGFILYIDSIQKAILSYGLNHQIKVKADGQSHTLRFQDNGKLYCMLDYQLPLLLPCSIDCRGVGVPPANAGPDKTLDCRQTTATLGKSSGTDSLVNFIWTDAVGNKVGFNAELIASAPGKYALTLAMKNNGCLSPADTVEVLLDTLPPDPTILVKIDSIDKCEIKSFALSHLSAINCTYQWMQGSNLHTDSILIVNDSGMVILHALDTLNGCEAADTFLAKTGLRVPVIEIKKVANLDCINREVVIDASNSAQGLAIRYRWYHNNNQLDTANTLKATMPGIYTLVVTDLETGCSNSDSVKIRDSAKKLHIDFPGEYLMGCADEFIDVTGKVFADATEIINESLIEIQWSAIWPAKLISGKNSLKPRMGSAGGYIVEVKNKFDGCTAIDTLWVAPLNDGPSSIQFEVEHEKCAGAHDGQMHIQKITGGSYPYQISLNNGQKNMLLDFTGLKPDKYALQLADAKGCTLDTFFTISSGKILDVEVSSEVTIDYGEIFLLQASVNRPLNELNEYQWSPDDRVSCIQCLETWIEGNEDGIFEFHAVDENGCKDSATTRVSVKRNIIITYPNIFSLSGNGNQTFNIYGNEHVREIQKLHIYDRWGNLIWVSSGGLNKPDLGWGGYFNGQRASEGVYTIYAEVEIFDGSIQKVRGDVTLVW